MMLNLNKIMNKEKGNFKIKLMIKKKREYNKK